MESVGENPRATTVLLFGPQTLSLQEQSSRHLRSTIRSHWDNGWMRATIDELPRYVKLLSQKTGKLQPDPALELLQGLTEWLDSDTPSPMPERLPNTVLTPLVVLAQLAQYTQYVEVAHVDAGLGCDRWSPQLRRSETLGFCTGFLSALTVSSASNKADFQTFGVIAVRLAALIGAFVDAEDGDGRVTKSTSLSAAWNTPERGEELKAAVAEDPDAYFSVYYDKTRATVTTSSQRSPFLQQRLRKQGIVASEIGLRGRYHCPSYREKVDDLIELCDGLPELQLPDASDTVIPMFSTTSGELITEGKLHHIALREILLEPCQWHQTFESMAASSLADKDSLLVVFGREKCIPPTLSRHINEQVVYMDNWEDAMPKLAALTKPSESYSDDDIAVVGMASKVAGADDLEGLWDLMCQAESQHVEVPQSRFTFDTHWREVDPKRKWFGNFIRDHDAFDHKFFKKSPREVTSQDPQQRLFLQSAYQAVEQSGYFNSSSADTHVGVYVGICAADYEANIACYQPNAFSATGNLKSFIAGKISHYFGWTGPGLTIDTACSASAVAVHQACRAILAGECTAALAGGATVMTSPLWFQNLAGASFLSTTGACKPFDAKADGYCRGEAVASVFLKKMGQAIKNGDTIIGCIRSTAVYQNENCTPIFVPNAPSLSTLFEDVIHKARLQPKDISLVEAHGTGTPVGDPAEYESIRRVCGGRSVRSSPMPIGSIKGLIGHTESASGVIALIKVLLLLYRGAVPPQASFQTLSPGIKATPDDMLEVVTRLTPWKSGYRAALINNYGASGSNASMVVTQAPETQETFASVVDHKPRQVFWISGMDERSLREYCIRLRKLIASHTSSTEIKMSLADLSYNLARQSNRTLPQGLILQCDSVRELDSKLADFIHEKSTDDLIQKKAPRPVILCFGGQVSQSVGLDKAVYDSHRLLQRHLDQCNSTLLSLKLNSVYPTMFEKSPVRDVVKLQTTLFALQYSCAKCWIDCGVPVAAVVGHSFGELTALCVAGVLSLKDCLRVVAARAKLIEDGWGPDPGGMVAVEADLAGAQELLIKAAVVCPGERSASIACYNGPRSFTLAGSTKAVEAVATCASTMSGLRTRKIAVSNAFHSTLVEPLEERLAKIAERMSFRKPCLHWERATEDRTTSEIMPEFFATHMRQPVYASQAFQRLHKDFPSAIWLEAGSNSTITNMARKALGSPSTSYFQAVNICSSSGLQNVPDIFVNLWKEGLNIHHWAHHPSQASLYRLVLLPQYQFEKSRHWLALKKPQVPIEQAAPQPQVQQEQLPTSLYTFVGYQGEEKRHARFRINTTCKKYEELVSGHVIAQTAPICPATVQIDMTIEALFNLRPDLETANLQPGIHNVSNQAPICIDPERTVWLDVRAVSDDFRMWNWDMTSSDIKGTRTTLHVKGQVVFRSLEDTETSGEFARYEGLSGHQRCLDFLNCSDPDDIIQGRNMYKVFSEIVNYAPPYHGLVKLVGKGNTSAGRVLKKHTGQTWLDPHLSDCFSQVGGFWVNCMTDRAPTDMYIAAGFESWIRAPRPVALNDSDRPSTWDVMAFHRKVSDKAYTSDIFIYDTLKCSLSEMILGVNYARIPKAVMCKTLTRLTATNSIVESVIDPSVASHAAAPPATTTSRPVTPVIPLAPSTVLAKSSHDAKASVSLPQTSTAKKQPSAGSAIFDSVSKILAELTGLESNIMKRHTGLVDIGIDSLMGMEMARELEATFKCTLDMDRLAEVLTIQDVTDCVASTRGVDSQYGEDGQDSPDGARSEESSDGSRTPEDSPGSVATVSDIEGFGLGAEQAEELQLPAPVVLEAFGESKLLTDQFITDYHCNGYMDTINPKQTQLCIALTLEAFEQLGCSVKKAQPGQKLEQIRHAPQHSRLVRYLYEVLETDGRLINIAGATITRTAVSAPNKSSKEIVNSVVAAHPDHSFANRLAYFCGSRLVDVLTGKLDGLKLIFGSDEGRDLVSGLYGDSMLNKLSYKQMEDILKRLFSKLTPNSRPLRVLEMGAGTGGTTKYLVPLLANLKVPVEYTFTDLAPSFVAAARKRYKEYSFVKFCSHDIEKAPTPDLIGTQHLVIASNAVHATHSLPESVKNIRKVLRPDGFLMMLEMTETLRWVDIIFGLLEGWWLFDDGRAHALSHQLHWERVLHSAGYGHVDWTDGHLPENRIQRVIIAMASGPKHDRLPVRDKSTVVHEAHDTVARKAAVDAYVQKYTYDRMITATLVEDSQTTAHCIVVTGATGSLGSHIAAHLAALPSVTTVVCLNRTSHQSEPEARQHKAFRDRGIQIDTRGLSKLRVLEADTSKSRLGLVSQEYSRLVKSVTHIVHNAWPMSGNRPIHRFEAQFQVMRNLINLCYEAMSTMSRMISFQFISSIAVVGHYPLWSENPLVPEERVSIESVLPNGYGDAKYACERMLDATLGQHPRHFRAMSVRLGQVAGNSKTGYWNTQEHLSFLVKSSQTLRALPDFDNQLSWTPVDLVAATLSDLLLRSSGPPDPVYHIDNPVRQPWRSMITVWARALDIPQSSIISFEEWARRVRHFPGSVEKDNPAYMLVDFLDSNFIRMSCGGLLLDTTRAKAHSSTLASVGPVSDEIALGYIQYWKEVGFLAR